MGDFGLHQGLEPAADVVVHPGARSLLAPVGVAAPPRRWTIRRRYCRVPAPVNAGCFLGETQHAAEHRMAHAEERPAAPFV